MTPQDVLLQLLDENDNYIRHILETAQPVCLYWQPDPAANSIAVLIWHVAKACDVFFNQHVHGLSAEQEEWIRGGWAEASGYDPRGVGTNGWGMLTGYTNDELAAIPAMDAEILRGYYDAVSGAIRLYLKNTSEAKLLEKAPGYGGQQTNWFWVRHPLFDMSRHVGEMLALKGQWERQSS